MKGSLRYAVTAALALLAPAAQAATFTWPTLFGAGCTCTLQQCIDAAAPGDVVQIGADDLLVPDRYTTVDENVFINQSLTLRGVPPRSSVKILTVDGRLIREIEAPGGDIGFWDGTDLDGDPVATGIYLIAASSDEGEAIGKIAVVRR